MRLSILAMGFVAVSVGCDNAATEAETPAAETTKAPSAPGAEDPAGAPSPKPAAGAALKAQLGGSVVAVGQHAVELRVHRAGLVEASVRGVDGSAVDPAAVKLELTAQAKGGQPVPIGLAWDEARGRFAGKSGGEAELVADPIDLKLSVGGKSFTGRLDHYALLSPPEFGGQMLAAGEYGAEVLASTDGSVRALVRDAAGVALAADASVQVELPTASGKSHLVALAPAEAALSGKAAAGVEFAPGPMQLTVKVGKETHVGAMAKLAIAAQAQHGGRIVTAGDYSVELTLEPAHLVAAYAFDASGKAHAEGDLALSLTLGAQAEREVKLAWDAPSASYRAKLDAAFNPSITPVQLAIRADGKLATGACASFATGGKLAAGGSTAGKLVANANAKASAKAPTAKAKLAATKSAAATAGVKASAPKVSVRKGASASTGKEGKSGAKANAKAGISLGIK